MRFSSAKVGLLASVFAAGFALPAVAVPTASYTLDKFGTSTGDYGTVALTNESGGVLVQVTPIAGTGGTGFVNTGAGGSLDFNLDVTTISVSGLTTGFSLVSTTSGSIGDDGSGTFNFEIDCSTTVCGTGGNAPDQSPFSFTVDSTGGPTLTASDFTSNGTGNIFASDLCVNVTSNDHCTAGANTGDVSAQGSSPPPRVPEPFTLSVFGAGLLGAAAMRRRKKA